MEVKVIAVTGGPCAGKTTALAWISENFQKLGWHVIISPEVATEVILAGFRIDSFKDFFAFERAVLKGMILHEKGVLASVKDLKSEKVLVVFDRGLLDVKAFMDLGDFRRLLKEVGLSEVGIWDRYDGVFHLVTAAKGAEQFYTLENNAARKETAEEAAEIDDKTIEAWSGHPHFRVVDNSTDFRGKMVRLMKEISGLLGEPEPYEIERKFVIHYPDVQWLENSPNCQKVEINQIYLKSSDKDEVRIRQRGIDGEYQYFLTTKRRVDEMTRVEKEQRINEREYLRRMMDADPERRPLRKTRYCLVYQSQYLEIDIYQGVTDWAILEIELNDRDTEVVFPPEIKVIEEVTGNPSFDNANLAKLNLRTAALKESRSRVIFKRTCSGVGSYYANSK